MTRPAGLSDASLRALLASPELSYAAKGVLAFVLTRPPGARVGLAELFAASADPMEQITKAVRELARAGLVATVAAGRNTTHSGGAIRLRTITENDHGRRGRAG
jgi:hypothetical protein